MDYKLSEIAKAIKSTNRIFRDVRINAMFIDSRNILPSEKSLFIAIKGKRNNGHQYVKELIDKGIRNFIVEEFRENYIHEKKCNFLVVKDSLEAFQKIAAWHRKNFNIPVVGITGSNGKTIVKEWLFFLLDGNLNIIRSPKSFNSQVGVPLSVVLLDKPHQLGIFEAGISQKGEMQKLANIIAPDFGIFTNLGDAHQENFKSFEQKALEKLRLFTKSKKIIYCSDHETIENALQKSGFKGEIFNWSEKKSSNLVIQKIQHARGNSTIHFSTQKLNSSIQIPFVDRASVENAIHCLAFLISNNYYTDLIKEKFSQLPPIGMRLEMMHGENNCTIINDSYNSDLNSIKIALDVLKRQQQHKDKCLILSDVLQSGEKDEMLYKNLESLVKSGNIQRFIGIGPKINTFFSHTLPNSSYFPDTESFLNSYMFKQFHNEAILIKGARNFEFNKISEVLQQKSHRTVLEINLEALEFNLNYYRSLLQPKTKIMVMVKAFSYGSGSYEIASFLEHQRIDYLGVAFTDEGVALRKAGVNLPVVVMNPETGSYRNIIDYKLEPEIYSFSSLKAFSSMAERYYRNPWPIHIKIDTGMKRLGFYSDEMEELSGILKTNKYLKVMSVFSHLAASGEAIHDTFSASQIEIFREAASKLQKSINYSFYRHILNSSGIERFPGAHFEMVRLGLGLHGIGASKSANLKNVATLKSHISQVKWVKQNETIGYSRKGIVDRDSKIAIVPIGYADGLDRKLSNRVGRVFINGTYALIVGNINMDMCMIDITDIEANEGDEVIIFGPELPITELAEKVNTIPYEILTGISQRVKRVYLHQ
ncbi:MAG: bifunctional UDP-N-acetylmuramoyl-tripeptide:D-alanyl-D-alanine ligase/alanine racemase [Bacteroidales bacterium]